MSEIDIVKTRPANAGKKWSAEEDTQLLNELAADISIPSIADTHKRTQCSIVYRCKEIAYKMHTKGDNIEIIIQMTKIDEKQLTEFIRKKENNAKGFKMENEFENEINELKNEITDLKSDVTRIKKMLKEICSLKSIPYSI